LSTPSTSRQKTVPSATADAFPLIGPGDPAPFKLYNENGKAPVLLVCDHASRTFPRAMNQLGLADWVLDKHVACDIGAAMVTHFLSDRLDAPAMLAGYSRLIVDLNRQTDSSTAFIEVSDGITVPGNLDLSDEEKADRITSFFDPYHGAISRQLEGFEQRGIQPAFISVHTCTPVFNQVVRQMHIGVMWDDDPRIARPLIRNLDAMDGICVGDNEPYSGKHPHDFTIDFHAEPNGLPYAGIEVRQDLVSDEKGARKWAHILADALEEVLAEVVGFEKPAKAVKA
jgi:predicted N-formylglutamate amidohydrolase